MVITQRNNSKFNEQMKLYMLEFDETHVGSSIKKHSIWHLQGSCCRQYIELLERHCRQGTWNHHHKTPLQLYRRLQLSYWCCCEQIVSTNDSLTLKILDIIQLSFTTHTVWISQIKPKHTRREWQERILIKRAPPQSGVSTASSAIAKTSNTRPNVM
jgi:hypothetical protein